MEKYIQMVETFLVQPSASRAVLFGLIAAWCGTHVIKRNSKMLRRWLDELDDDSHRVVVRCLAFLMAWVPVALLWPAESLTERFLAAGVTAISAPYAYSLFTTIAFHFWPWLEPKMSARPRAAAED